MESEGVKDALLLCVCVSETEVVVDKDRSLVSERVVENDEEGLNVRLCDSVSVDVRSWDIDIDDEYETAAVADKDVDSVWVAEKDNVNFLVNVGVRGDRDFWRRDKVFVSVRALVGDASVEEADLDIDRDEVEVRVSVNANVEVADAEMEVDCVEDCVTISDLEFEILCDSLGVWESDVACDDEWVEVRLRAFV